MIYQLIKCSYIRELMLLSTAFVTYFVSKLHKSQQAKPYGICEVDVYSEIEFNPR
jgi:hypothetical protein